MKSTMPDFDLGVGMILRHARDVYGDSRVVDRWAGVRDRDDVRGARRRWPGGWRRDCAVSAFEPGDRVATVCWNHRRHAAAYLAVPSMGAVLHTVNLRLASDELAYVLHHAGDGVVIADGSLLPILAASPEILSDVRTLVVVGEPEGEVAVPTVDFDDLVAEGDADYPWPDVDERSAADAVLHERHDRAAQGCGVQPSLDVPPLARPVRRERLRDRRARRRPDGRADVPRQRVGLAVLVPVVGRRHGDARLRPLGPARWPDAIEAEQATLFAAVPTLVHDLLRHGAAIGADLGTLRVVISGGSAVPRALIDEVRAAWGVRLVQGWGMTETSPLAALSFPPKSAQPRGRIVVAGQERTGDGRGRGTRRGRGRPSRCLATDRSSASCRSAGRG